MKVYSVLIPQHTSATLYNKNGIWYHTQNSQHPHPITNLYWDSELNKIVTNFCIDIPDIIDSPLFLCKIEDVYNFVKQQITLYTKLYEEGKYFDYSMFVAHTDLNNNPVYLSFSLLKGDGEKFWEKS